MLLVYCKPLIGLGLIQTNNKGQFFYSKLSPRVSFKAASSPFIPGVYCDSDQLCSFKPAVKQVSAYLSYTYGRNLTRAHIAGLWHERGNPCCRHNPARMSFYSNRLLLGLTHIFKRHFQFITSSFASLWKVSNVTAGSSLSPQAHLSHCGQVTSGRACSSSIVFSWAVRPPSVTTAKSRLPKKEKAGESSAEHAAYAQTTCWGDHRGLHFDISWSDSQFVVELPGMHISCLAFVPLPRAVELFIHGMITYLITLFHKHREGDSQGE